MHFYFYLILEKIRIALKIKEFWPKVDLIILEEGRVHLFFKGRFLS